MQERHAIEKRGLHLAVLGVDTGSSPLEAGSSTSKLTVYL